MIRGEISRDIMASSQIHALLALIFCAVCIGTPSLSSAPPPPPGLISVCPAFNSSICLFSKPGPPECFNDSMCNDSKKCCCFGNCGLKCVTPETVKAGRCPGIKAKCHPEPTVNCTTDSDCPGSQKCCSVCGRTCWDPAPEPKGICPKIDGAQPSPLQCNSANCSRNSDCKAGELCCRTGDGQSCVNTSTAPDLISVCPAFNPSKCLRGKPGRPACQNDSQCSNSKKCCCSINCGWTCVTPDKVKAGRCPDIKAKCRPEPTFNCTTDSDCPGSQKCCGVYGRTCWDPAPEPAGVCPRNYGGQSRSPQCPSVHCSRDSDCKVDEKCCASRNGQICVKTNSPKTERYGEQDKEAHGESKSP